MNTYTSPYVLVMNVNKNENGIQGEGKLGKKGEGIGSADNDNEQNNANNDNYKTGGPAVQASIHTSIQILLTSFRLSSSVMAVRIVDSNSVRG